MVDEVLCFVCIYILIQEKESFWCASSLSFLVRNANEYEYEVNSYFDLHPPTMSLWLSFSILLLILSFTLYNPPLLIILLAP